MSWYVLQCRAGREAEMVNSLNQHLSREALEEAFYFQSERLWRSEGSWKRQKKELFPGYVFLQSEHPGLLSKALEEYRQIVRIMEEPGYLISVYPEEEEYLRGLCGTDHFLPLSYGYKDRVTGCSRITKGPLAGRENQVKIFDWHRRFARMEISIENRQASVWAGLALDEAAVS